MSDEIEIIHYVDLEMMNDRGHLLAATQQDLQKLDHASVEERQAVGTYRGPGAAINNCIRQNRIHLDYKPTIDNLDALLKRAKLEKSIKVYRGFRANGQEVLKKMKPGDIFSDPGFMSTSLDPCIAFNFSPPEDKRIMRITLPKGSYAVHGAAAGSPGEFEVILPRNIKLHLDHIHQTSYIMNGHVMQFLHIYEFSQVESEE